jgi:hypothetical protein
MAKLQRKAKGERPYFFPDPNVDKVIAMVMGLAGEVAVLHDRVDTLERLLKKKAGIERAAIENYKPSAKVMAERAAWREQFLGEVLRIVEIEQEALAKGDTGRYDDAIALVEEPVQPKRRAKKEV